MKELKVKETELSKLNKDLLQNEIRALKSQISELNTIIGKVNQNKTVLNVDTWKKLIDTNKAISELEKNTQKGITEIAKSEGIEFYETNEFYPRGESRAQKGHLAQQTAGLVFDPCRHCGDIPGRGLPRDNRRTAHGGILQGDPVGKTPGQLYR